MSESPESPPEVIKIGDIEPASTPEVSPDEDPVYREVRKIRREISRINRRIGHVSQKQEQEKIVLPTTHTPTVVMRDKYSGRLYQFLFHRRSDGDNKS